MHVRNLFRESVHGTLCPLNTTYSHVDKNAPSFAIVGLMEESAPA